MFLINERTGKISLTKGDTATMNIRIDDLDGKPYSPTERDELKLTVRRNVNRPVVVEVTANEDHKFVFLPEDTKDVDAGIYMYDIQLTTEEGHIYTLISARFVIMDEIGD